MKLLAKDAEIKLVGWLLTGFIRPTAVRSRLGWAQASCLRLRFADATWCRETSCQLINNFAMSNSSDNPSTSVLSELGLTFMLSASTRAASFLSISSYSLELCRLWIVQHGMINSTSSSCLFEDTK